MSEFELFTPTPAELIAELNEIWPEGNMEYRHFTIEIDADRWVDKWVATHENYEGPESNYPVITGSCQDDVIEQIDDWLAACPHKRQGETYAGKYCKDCDENIGD